MSPLRIIDESPEFLVVEKPAHLLVHPSKPGGPPTLWDHLRGLLAFELANGGQVSIINRLDRETSGLTLIAKSHEAARYFSGLMQQRRLHKEYLAVVTGWPAADAFVIDQPILRQGSVQASRIWLKQMIHPHGAVATTRFEVLSRHQTAHGRLSLVRAHPLTGRMHQIRLHLASAGHAVLGDKIYGPDEGHYLRFIETGWTDELAGHLVLPRHALHSTRLRVENSAADWHSPLPEDLRHALDSETNAAATTGR